MFNALGSIFSARPRRAEQSDTRQSIQRHARSDQRRRRQSGRKVGGPFTGEDATVCVAALRLFLENFVENSGARSKISPATGLAAPGRADNARPRSESGHAPGPAAHAASSYANAAQAGAPGAILIETTDSASGPRLELSAADIRTIYALIADLHILKAHNIEYLQIGHAASFLDSLVEAVRRVKAAL